MSVYSLAYGNGIITKGKSNPTYPRYHPTWWKLHSRKEKEEGQLIDR